MWNKSLKLFNYVPNTSIFAVLNFHMQRKVVFIIDDILLILFPTIKSENYFICVALGLFIITVDIRVVLVVLDLTLKQCSILIT